jgi:hypothetical protein
VQLCPAPTVVPLARSHARAVSTHASQARGFALETLSPRPRQIELGHDHPLGQLCVACAYVEPLPLARVCSESTLWRPSAIGLSQIADGFSNPAEGLFNETLAPIPLRTQLRMRSHSNRALQQDLNDLGPEAFELEILDTLPTSDRPNYDPSDDLRTLEALWLEKLSPFGDRGYNAKPKGTA